MSENKLWSIKFTPYTDCLFPVSPLNASVVWPRLKNFSGEDASVLFVGYSNLKTQYGDEGVKYFLDTPKCGRTAFFTGDELKYSPNSSSGNNNNNSEENQSSGDYYENWIPRTRVDQQKYNHFYGDFRNLRKDFAYLIDSQFFNYIFIGDRTFIYFTTIDIVSDFCSMLKNGGSLFIAVNGHTLVYYYGPFLDSYLGYDYDFVPYFYNTPAKNAKLLSNVFLNYRSIMSDYKNNSVIALQNELSDDIPFLENFIDQNKTDNSILHHGQESCIIRIIKIDK